MQGDNGAAPVRRPSLRRIHLPRRCLPSGFALYFRLSIQRRAACSVTSTPIPRPIVLPIRQHPYQGTGYIRLHRATRIALHSPKHCKRLQIATPESEPHVAGQSPRAGGKGRNYRTDCRHYHPPAAGPTSALIVDQIAPTRKAGRPRAVFGAAGHNPLSALVVFAILKPD